VSRKHQLVAMVTRVSLRQIWNLDDAVKLPDPENPHFGANILLLSLKMAVLLPFEVALGRNANFHILGEKRGKCENSSSRPPKGTSLHQNASFGA